MLYDDGDGRRPMGFDRNSVELKVSKRAFDCPEVDFWGGQDDLKITTSAPSLEIGAQPQAAKKRKIQKMVGLGGTLNQPAPAPTATPEDESPDFVAPVEWRMIRNEITKDLKVGEWAFDCATLEMWWSVEIFRIFGMDHNFDKPTFATYKNLLHRDDKDLVLFLFQRALEKGVPYEVSHRFSMAGDKVKWCRVKCRVQLDPGRNGVTKLFGTIQDITLWSKSVIEGRKNLTAFVDSKNQPPNSNGDDTVTEDPTCCIS